MDCLPLKAQQTRQKPYTKKTHNMINERHYLLYMSMLVPPPGRRAAAGHLLALNSSTAKHNAETEHKKKSLVSLCLVFHEVFWLDLHFRGTQS